MMTVIAALAVAPLLLAQAPSTPGTSTWLVPWDAADLTDSSLSCFSEIDPFSYAFDRKGNVILAYPQLLSAVPRSPERLVLPVIVNDVIEKKGEVTEKSPELLASIFNDDKRMRRHVSKILKTLPLDQIDGVEIDYERVPPGAWPRYVKFLGLLGQELHARGKRLYVDVEVGPLLGKDGGRGAFSEMARAVDTIKVMAYYQRGEWGDEVGPGNSLSWVADVARRALVVIPREKLAIALSLSATDWELPYPRVASMRRVTRLHYDKVVDLLAKQEGSMQWSDSEKAPFFDYEAQGAKHRLWYEDSRSIAAKIDALKAAGVTRIALWYLGKRHVDLSTSGLCSR